MNEKKEKYIPKVMANYDYQLFISWDLYLPN